MKLSLTIFSLVGHLAAAAVPNFRGNPVGSTLDEVAGIDDLVRRLQVLTGCQAQADAVTACGDANPTACGNSAPAGCILGNGKFTLGLCARGRLFMFQVSL
jgi:hypothetical protein